MSQTGPWRIGAVARMIGVPTPTLRTWERRYGVVDPGRTDGDERLYDAEDVERLRLIAWLRERGERVADLARLPLAALAERSTAHERAPTGVGVRVVVHAADELPILEGPVPGGGEIAIVARASLEAELPEDGVADVAVLDLRAAGVDPVARVRELSKAWDLAAVVVVHGLVSSRTRVALVEAGARLVRTPVDALQLSRLVVDLAAARGQLTELSARPARFATTAVQVLANRPVTLACECPNHLSALLLGLAEFEQYSRDCASRSPQDAMLHRSLAEGTARARMIVEDLLAAVCVHEGIPLPLVDNR